MNCTQLTDLVYNRIHHTSNKIPQDAFAIATQLNIRLKNSIECRVDFQDKNPLQNTHAVYALNNGEYTIYYDENYPYKNFSIAHEIAHHLLHHTSDGMAEHHDAQLLAAIMIAPPQMIRKSRIHTAESLSVKCKIPSDVAAMYWQELKIPLYQRHKIAIILSAVIIAAVIIVTCTSIKFSTSDKEADIHTTSTNVQESIQQEPTTEAVPAPDCVFVSLSGKKYHKSTCKHIKGSTLIELSIEEATKAGYEPCKDCMP